MYKLGYIKGYDSFNTMKFSSLQQQKDYFDYAVVETFNAYYPPYYKNTIKLSIEDLDYTQNSINFAILVHNNKYYYYFITSIDYINEEIYEITLELDTIQTFMFDLKISSAVKVRENIKRWNGNYINRDYIRENKSLGFFEPAEFEYTTQQLYIIVVTDTNMTDMNNRDTIIIDFDNYAGVVGSGLYVHIYPVPNIMTRHNITIRLYFDFNDTYLDKTYLNNNNMSLGMGDLLRCPYVKNIFLVTSDKLDKLIRPTFENDDATDTTLITMHHCISETDFKISFGTLGAFKIEIDREQYKYYPLTPIVSLDSDFEDIKTKSIKANGDFSKNSNIGVNFDYHYCPQLIDENYIQVAYGEKLGASSFPLHQLTSTNIKLFNGYDLIEGNRAYKICRAEEEYNYYDVYNTIVVNVTKENFVLINDAWANYYANNKGSLTTGLQTAMANNVYSFFKGIGTSTLGYEMNYALANQFERGSTPGLMFGGKALQNIVGGITAKTDFLMNTANLISNYNVTRENLEHAPATLGQGSTIVSDYIAKAFLPFYSTQVINDIEYCGRQLEYYGYAINKVVHDINIYSDDIRYYYNVKQFANISLYNSNTSISMIFIKDFASRLEAGIRMFNVVRNGVSDYNFIDNLKYDNVEIEEVS